MSGHPTYAHFPRPMAASACRDCAHVRNYRTHYRVEWWCDLARQAARIEPDPKGHRPAGLGRLDPAMPSCKYFEAKP